MIKIIINNIKYEATNNICIESVSSKCSKFCVQGVYLFLQIQIHHGQIN